MKKLLALLISLTCVSPLCIHAEEPTVFVFETQEEAVPYARLCGLCRKGTIKETVIGEGEWYNKGEQTDCVHHTYGTDLKEYRDTIIQHQCTNCLTSYNTTTTETRSSCHGYY